RWPVERLPAQPRAGYASSTSSNPRTTPLRPARSVCAAAPRTSAGRACAARRRARAPAARTPASRLLALTAPSRDSLLAPMAPLARLAGMAGILLAGGCCPTRLLPVMREVSAVSLPIERYTLDNGLEVVLHEDHRSPVAAVNLWYHVGSKDEPAHRNGFAHL